MPRDFAFNSKLQNTTSRVMWAMALILYDTFCTVWMIQLVQHVTVEKRVWSVLYSSRVMLKMVSRQLIDCNKELYFTFSQYLLRICSDPDNPLRSRWHLRQDDVMRERHFLLGNRANKLDPLYPGIYYIQYWISHFLCCCSYLFIFLSFIYF